MKKQIRIGIDARLYGPKALGIGRYVKELVQVLVADGRFHYVLFLPSAAVADFAKVKGVTAVALDAPYYSWQEQLLLPQAVRAAKVDLMHYTHFNAPWLSPKPFVLTIHDLIPWKFPNAQASTRSPWVYRLKLAASQRLLRRSLAEAAGVLAVSRNTAADLADDYQVPGTKIKVVYEGVAKLPAATRPLLLSPETAEAVAGDFFLYAGSAHPHKNLSRLLRAFAEFRVRHPEQHLILAGKEDYFYRRLHQEASDLGLTEGLHFVGFVSDAELAFLYQRAKAFVFPSLYEGFGLPALEALACHCPVLSSNRGSLPEILGDAALYFDPLRQSDIIKALEALTSNQALRQALLAAGRERLANFDWQRCGKQTADFYEKVLCELKK